MLRIALFSLILTLSGFAVAQDQSQPAPVSPVQTALDAARESVRENDPEAAVLALRGLFDLGFTGVGVITSDTELAELAGYEGFDTLIEEMTVAAFPCEYDPRFQEFDFWIGDWDVHVANGTYAGHNTITSAEHGCLLLESWISGSGGTGSSINYLDKISGKWVQIWNASGGSQINIRGGLTEDGMLLVGTIHYVANGTTAAFRGLWTPLPDGRVRQYFEQADESGENWSPWFEGFYTRTDTAE